MTLRVILVWLFSVAFALAELPRPSAVVNIRGIGLRYESDETVTSTNLVFYHYDSRGSTIALTDGSGNVTDQIEYSPYGMTTHRTGTTDTPFLYNGQFGVQTDPNGLLYMRARYYNPYICRFLNPDPSGFAGGLNCYQFCSGNPISLTDPFGLDAQESDTHSSWIQNVKGFFSLDLNTLAENPQQSLSMLTMATPAITAFNPGGEESVSFSENAESTTIPETTSATVSATLVAEQNAAEGELSGTALARQLGQAGEDAVGITGPKVGITIPGTDTIRFPDQLTSTTLTEVKNVQNLSLTQQLQDYSAYAQQNGLQFNLYVRPTTTLSGPLQNAINNGLINKLYIPTP